MKKYNIKAMCPILVVLLVQGALVVTCVFADSLFGAGPITQFLHKHEVAVLIYSGILSSAIIMFYLFKFIASVEDINKEKSIKGEIKNKENIITDLRAQKHDFVNHLQVIYGLVQLKSQEKIKDYINYTMKDLYATSEIHNFEESPIINALLIAKFSQGKSIGIKFSWDLQVDFKALKINQYKAGRILANIIDNAMDAARNIPQEKRCVDVKIYNDRSKIYFEVVNSGPIINKADLKTIFEPGFTTKHEKGHGMGLYIVKQLINELGGTITVSSNRGKGTTVIVALPLLEDNGIDARSSS